MYTIEVYSREIQLEKPFAQIVVLIGRAKDNDIVLLDRFASAHHLMLIQLNGRLYLKDRNSRNGTRLNGRWVRGEHELLPGQDIVMGATLIRIREDHDGGDRTKKIRMVPRSEDPDTTPTTPTTVHRTVAFEPVRGDFADERTPIPYVPAGRASPPVAVPKPKRAPTRASLRRLIDVVVTSPAELRALLVDDFPNLARQVPAEMEVIKVVSLLLERESPVEVLHRLQLAFPRECAEHWHLLEWE